MTLQLLGRFDLHLAGRTVELDHDAERLVALLALRRRRVARGEVIRALWPCRTTARAVRDLRHLYDRLPDEVRRRVDVDEDGTLGLVGEWTVDLDLALAASRRLHRDPGADAADIVTFGHGLLPDWDDEWLSELQDRYRRLRLSVLQRVGHHLLATGRLRGAVELGRMIVSEDGMREDGQHLLIAALARSGRHDLAHQQYVRYRARLRHEWGVAPSPQLHALIARAHHPSSWSPEVAVGR